MPKIQWTNLPPALRDHLFDRLRERKITVEDLYRLKLWRESEPPEAPKPGDSAPMNVLVDGLTFPQGPRPATARA